MYAVRARIRRGSLATYPAVLRALHFQVEDEVSLLLWAVVLLCVHWRVNDVYLLNGGALLWVNGCVHSNKS